MKNGANSELRIISGLRVVVPPISYVSFALQKDSPFLIYKRWFLRWLSLCSNSYPHFTAQIPCSQVGNFALIRAWNVVLFYLSDKITLSESTLFPEGANLALSEWYHFWDTLRYKLRVLRAYAKGPKNGQFHCVDRYLYCMVLSMELLLLISRLQVRFL